MCLLLFTVKDLLFVTLHALGILVIVALLSWLLDADIYINFLIIIDLGLFFVLISFFLNLHTLFQSTRPERFTVRGSYLVFLFFIVFSTTNLNLIPLLLNTSSITYYDWYSLLNLSYFADLQLLSDLYYTGFLFEFLLMNIYLYVTIFILLLIQYGQKVINYLPKVHQRFTALDLALTGDIVRTQNTTKQERTVARVRVWGYSSNTYN